VSKLKDFPEILKIVSKVPDEQVLSDLDATVKFAKGTGKADTEKLAVTGFCWGGRIVWLYAAHNPGVKAGAAWYGRLKGEPDALHPKNPIDVVGDLKAPVLGLYGEADNGIPVPTVEAMRDALKEKKQPSEIILYKDTPHGFNADYRPSYRKDKAEEAWAKMLDWFKQNGVA
jgi:carboxymethylenebutenolidase